MERHKPMESLVRLWLFRAIVFSLLVLSVASTTPASQNEITVEVYCQMTVKLMELSLQEWQERVAAVGQGAADRKRKLRVMPSVLEWRGRVTATGQADRDERIVKLEEITRRNQSLRDDVHRQYGMSAKDELRYVSEHASEIDSYLEDNPEVRESIQSLKRNINILIEQFEAVVNPRGEGAPQ